MKYLNKLMFGIAVMMLLVSAWVAPAAAAPPDADAAQQRDFTGGKYIYRLMLIRLNGLQDAINNVQDGAGLGEEYIAEEQANGYDTTILETGLRNFQAKLTEAQGHHDRAADILNEHAGFDDDGTIIDPRQARETIQNARDAMREAIRDLRDGRREFREALQDYQQSKRGQ